MDAEIYSLLADIQAEAINASVAGRAHVFVDYSGHVHVLSVRALPVDTAYDGTPKRNLIEKRIDLEYRKPELHRLLTEARDEIRALGVEEEAG